MEGKSKNERKVRGRLKFEPITKSRCCVFCRPIRLNNVQCSSSNNTMTSRTLRPISLPLAFIRFLFFNSSALIFRFADVWRSKPAFVRTTRDRVVIVWLAPPTESIFLHYNGVRRSYVVVSQVSRVSRHHRRAGLPSLLNQ